MPLNMKEERNILIIIGLISFIVSWSFWHIWTDDFSVWLMQLDGFLKHRAMVFYPMPEGYINLGHSPFYLRPPFYPGLMLLSVKILGRNMFAMAFPLLVARFFMPVVFYKCLRYYYSRAEAFFLSLWVLFMPKLQTFSFSNFEADSIVLILILCAWLMLERMKENPRRIIYGVIFGAMCGFACLTREAGVAMACALFGAMLLRLITGFKSKELINQAIVSAVVCLIVVLPYIIWSMRVMHTPYFTGMENVQKFGIFFRNIWGYIKVLFFTFFSLRISMLPWLFMGIFFAGMWYAVKKRQWELFFLLVLPVLAFSLLPEEFSHAVKGGCEAIRRVSVIAPAVIAMFALGVGGIAGAIRKDRIRNMVKYAVFFLITFIFMLFSIHRPKVLVMPDEYYISLGAMIDNPVNVPDLKFERIKDKFVLIDQSQEDAARNITDAYMPYKRVKIYSGKSAIGIFMLFFTGCFFLLSVKKGNSPKGKRKILPRILKRRKINEPEK